MRAPVCKYLIKAAPTTAAYALVVVGTSVRAYCVRWWITMDEEMEREDGIVKTGRDGDYPRTVNI